MGAIARWWCRREGHDWFPDNQPSEFIVTTDICLRCSEERVVLPWGQCLNDHPIAEHYTGSGQLQVVSTCAGPL